MSAQIPSTYLIVMWLIYIALTNYQYNQQYKQAHQKLGIDALEYRLRFLGNSLKIQYKSGRILHYMTMALILYSLFFLMYVFGQMSLIVDGTSAASIVAPVMFKKCAKIFVLSGVVTQINAARQYKAAVELEVAQPRRFFTICRVVMALRDFGTAVLFALYYFT